MLKWHKQWWLYRRELNYFNSATTYVLLTVLLEYNDTKKQQTSLKDRKKMSWPLGPLMQ